MQNKLLRFLFYLVLGLLLLQVFSGNPERQASQTDDLIIRSKEEFVIGQEVQLELKNNSEQAIRICETDPGIVERYQNGEWTAKNPRETDCENTLAIEPGATQQIAFGEEGYELFSETGRYKVSFQTEIDGSEKNYLHEISIKEPSLIRRAWNGFLYKPILNILVYFISVLPSHNLGWGIILLTLVMKLLLLGPNQKALKAQRKLQTIQPQLDAIKQKYKDDPQRVAQETMEVWKKYKVNPLGSCLPMLIQFPILIALFYVVRDGLAIIDPNLLYETLQGFDVKSVDPIFLGAIDLTQRNILVLPLIVAGLQFFQIRLSLGKSKKNIQKGAVTAMPPMMNNMMQLFLPLMIAVFTASLPAAVGFYWGTSTLFAIGQQIAVNYSKD